jgi:hypothetical protein
MSAELRPEEEEDEEEVESDMRMSSGEVGDMVCVGKEGDVLRRSLRCLSRSTL